MQHQNTLENQEIKNLIEQPEQEIIQAQVQIQVQEIQMEIQGHPQQEIIQGQQPILSQQPNIQAEILNNNSEQPQEQQSSLQQQQFQQQQQQFQQQQQWHQQQQEGFQFQQVQQIRFSVQQNVERINPSQLTPAQAVAILSTIPIPDQFCFTHEFRSQSPCCEECGGFNMEESIITLPSIGQLSFDVQFNLPARCDEPKDPKKMAALLSRYIPQKALTLNTDDHSRGCCSNEHFFRQHTYSLQNNNVRIEFFGHVGKMYIKGVLVLEFVECIKNYSDVFQGSKFSTMPQMVIYEPQYHSSTKQTYPIRMKAQKSNCPEHPYSFLGFQSIYGCCKLQRPFEIYGLKQGTCEILNRRTQNNACNSHLGFRDSFICNFDCCNFPDYKDFEVSFQNVIYIDRLKILLGLIHFNMYNKWEHTDYKGRFLLFQLYRIARKIKYGDAGQCSIF